MRAEPKKAAGSVLPLGHRTKVCLNHFCTPTTSLSIMDQPLPAAGGALGDCRNLVKMEWRQGNPQIQCETESPGQLSTGKSLLAAGGFQHAGTDLALPRALCLWYPQDGKHVQKINGITQQPSLFGHSLVKRANCPQIICTPFSYFTGLVPSSLV